MEVYDFSKKGRVEYLGKQAHLDLGGLRYLSSTGASVRLPWKSTEFIGMDGSRDNGRFDDPMYSICGHYRTSVDAVDRMRMVFVL